MSDGTKHHSSRVVGISNGYLVLRILYDLGCFLLFFVFFWIFFMIFAGTLGVELPIKYSSIISLVFSAVMVLNDVLYWKKSGVFIHTDGDHVVKIGGFFSHEDRLLDTVVISSQITRGPIDQLFGMATISVGLFGNKRLVGI